MNLPKKGPDLKLSELKVPDFLYDLYYDLKERHLLPLVAVLAVSIVVVPIALSNATGSAGEEEAAVAAPRVAGGESSTLAVARSAPGLRDYRQRLRDAHALDPFRQASGAAAASEASGATATGEPDPPPEASEATGYAPVEAPVESAPSVSAPSEYEASGYEPSGTTTVTETRTKFASSTLDVRIVAVPQSSRDARASAKPSTEVRRGLPELTMLPSREAPAAVFMGISSDGKKALLLVSSDVESIFGDGQCIVGSQTCQLLALEAGVPETFVYGPRARTYRIEVLEIGRALSDKPHKASLGISKESAGRVSSAQPR